MGDIFSHCCMLWFPEEQDDDNVEILIKNYKKFKDNEFVTHTRYRFGEETSEPIDIIR